MSLSDLPTYLADYAGTSELVAQLLLSSMVIFAFLLPTLYLARNQNSTLTVIVVLFLAEGLCVALGFLPAWMMIATVVIMASGVALLGQGIIKE